MIFIEPTGLRSNKGMSLAKTLTFGSSLDISEVSPKVFLNWSTRVRKCLALNVSAQEKHLGKLNEIKVEIEMEPNLDDFDYEGRRDVWHRLSQVSQAIAETNAFIHDCALLEKELECIEEDREFKRVVRSQRCVKTQTAIRSLDEAVIHLDIDSLPVDTCEKDNFMARRFYSDGLL